MNRVADRKTDFNTKAGKCAKEFISYLIKNHLWSDVTVYVDGKRFINFDGEHWYSSPDNKWDKVFVEENVNPVDYFSWNGDFMSASFEGELYHILNYSCGDRERKIRKQLRELFKKYDMYYLLGDAWNFSLYKNF